LAHIFQVLAVPTRVRIVQLTWHNPLCVNALADRLGVTAAATSQHLRVLRDAGLVTPVRRGYFIHYQVDETTLAKWRGLTSALLEPQRGSKGNRRRDACRATDCCPKPKSLKGKPQDWSPEQIRTRHGKANKHHYTGQRTNQSVHSKL
jgi:DNA-binding transcriptional ArsR family regulator